MSWVLAVPYLKINCRPLYLVHKVVSRIGTLIGSDTEDCNLQWICIRSSAQASSPHPRRPLATKEDDVVLRLIVAGHSGDISVSLIAEGLISEHDCKFMEL